jgi:OmpA-OmpF porin, OOP family
MYRTRSSAMGSALLVAALASASVAAADQGFYVGLDAGMSSFGVSQEELDDVAFGAIEDAGFSVTTPGSDFDDSGTAYGLVVGYRISKNFAVEGSYVDLGQADYGAGGSVTNGITTVPMFFSVDILSKGPALSVMGILPLNESWSLDARLGAFFGEFSADIAVTSAAISDSGTVSNSSASTLYGVGVDYAFTSHWSVRLDYRRFDNVGDSDVSVDLASAGLRYAF